MNGNTELVIPDVYDSPEYIIFHKFFLVFVAEKFLVTEFTEEHFGTRKSGDKGIDKDFGNRTRAMPSTIVQIAEWIDLGASIRFHNHEDCVPVASHIRKHIDNWLHVMQTDRSAVCPPIDDFRKLETLMLLAENSMANIPNMTITVVDSFSRLFGRQAAVTVHSPFDNIRIVNNTEPAMPIRIDGKVWSG